MKAIEIMNEEHKYIIRMLHVIRKCCFKILNGEDVYKRQPFSYNKAYIG